MVATVVDLVESWHNYDKKHGGRLIQIRKSYLVLLSTMCGVKQNRAKLSELENMQKLFAVADGMIRKHAPDELTKVIIFFMKICYLTFLMKICNLIFLMKIFNSVFLMKICNLIFL